MDVVIRSSIVFFVLYVLLRVMGRRELSQLTPFDLVVLIVLGDLVQQGVTQEDMSITGATLASGTMVFWMVALSAIAHRWRFMRPALRGAPILVIRDGKPVDEAMHCQGLDVQYICDAARQQGISDLSQVRYGVLESDGMFSFVRHQDEDDSDAGSESQGAGRPSSVV